VGIVDAAKEKAFAPLFNMIPRFLGGSFGRLGTWRPLLRNLFPFKPVGNFPKT
jgi:hypothetical protein